MPAEGATLGLIINPVAGMGGSVGLKGTDGEDVLREAWRRGARPAAEDRARGAVLRLSDSATPLRVLTGSGESGEDVARTAGLDVEVVHRSAPGPTTSADTRAAAEIMAARSVDLLLFVGGDGTARDVLSAVGDGVPVLGVPAGVKMHSAVFGTSPRNAGHLAALFLAGSPAARLREAEVMDLDEAAFRGDRLSARLYGYARSPYERHLSQNAKAGSGMSSEASLDLAARQVAAGMRPGRLYILGPGTTTRRVAHALGLSSTLLGVDAVVDGEFVGVDLDEQGILEAMQGRETWIVVGVLGGQGSLFGRGNQQISAEVIRRAGRDRIIVVSSLEKLIALETASLHVDTGDAEVDAMLAGFVRIETGPNRSTLFKVEA
ncbi:ATP-NAD kinase family protein [Actinoplanes solisilvae]|uniref:ATP-NAD kinase family protein n=1 Tax=Actinoplanes solisilvae TaxID=2486853 RepID=UPI000FDB49B0|nr:ATP-NAD kinase family protein [Actinoplanes solisilvae]